jgi:hypothetical protein
MLECESGLGNGDREPGGLQTDETGYFGFRYFDQNMHASVLFKVQILITVQKKTNMITGSVRLGYTY